MAPTLPRRAPRALAAALAALAGLVSEAGADPAPLLAGHLPLDADLDARWCWSGAWVWPVGEACAGDGGYAVNRGLESGARGGAPHHGVDLCNRRAGGTVRAAASGVVVRASETGRGYGVHAVIAHRLLEGGVAYTVYAHLAPGSLRVAAGWTVAAGAPIGRVGRSGRASTDHLHFEVRLPERLDRRWERCRAVDPLAFLEARRSCRDDDTTWARPYLEWAHGAALAPPGADAGAPIGRHAWWGLLARAARHDFEPPAEAAALRQALIERALLDPGTPHDDRPVAWAEAAAGLERLRRAGLRVPAFDGGERHLALRERRLPPAAGGASAADAPPSLAELCLAVADLAASGAAAAGGPEPAR